MHDLFEWAADRAKAEVIDFKERRQSLPRWIMRADRDGFIAQLRAFDRAIELEAPAPILPFQRRA